jgi:predicted O-methyltransferase YrrM
VPILSEHVARYLTELRPERGEVMREMEELAQRERVPIVHWETGRLLAALCRALDPVVLEVGTAIGYSTLHMAEQLERGRIVTLELDPERAAQARGFLSRAGVAERVDLIEGDARETIRGLDGPFGLLFIDAKKTEYREYLELAEPKLSQRGLLVIDNVLMSGEVALAEGSETFWGADSLAAARRLNADLLESERWVGAVLPVGDGVAVAARRAKSYAPTAIRKAAVPTKIRAIPAATSARDLKRWPATPIAKPTPSRMKNQSSSRRRSSGPSFRRLGRSGTWTSTARRAATGPA